MFITSAREPETGNAQNTLGNTDINVMEDGQLKASPACYFIKDVFLCHNPNYSTGTFTSGEGLFQGEF